MPHGVAKENTALGALPPGWTVRALSELSTKIGSGATPRGGRSAYLEDRVSHALIRSQNVYDRMFDSAGLVYLSKEQSDGLRGVELRAGDVLLNITGDGVTFARACIVPDDVLPACVNQHVSIIRTNPEVCDPGYLLSFLTHPLTKIYMESFSTGGSRRALTKGHIESFKIPLPPIQIQRRIASALSAYDDLIKNCQRRIRILEDMARSLYREWFVQFRFPGHENHPRVASPLGEIPEGWKVGRLGDVAEEMRRNVAKGAVSDPTPYVGLEHIPRRSLALDAWDIATELGSNKLAFNKGEVLFGKIRPYFHKVSIAPFDGLCSADTIVIGTGRAEDQAFVTAVVSSDEFVAHASATANGAKMPRANWNVLQEYRVVIPDWNIARRFSEAFGNMVSQQQTLIFRINNLRHTRDLLLPRLLSGQVDLKVA